MSRKKKLNIDRHKSTPHIPEVSQDAMFQICSPPQVLYHVKSNLRITTNSCR